VRAELIARTSSRSAGTQPAHAQALGYILIEIGATKARFAHMMRLQTTETLYNLFAWKNGSYDSRRGRDSSGAPSNPSGPEVS